MSSEKPDLNGGGHFFAPCHTVTKFPFFFGYNVYGDNLEQIVYADVLFLINFSMDFLSLFLTGKILHKKINLIALVISAAIGAIYAIAALIYQGSELIGALIHLAVAILLCFISFGGHTVSLCKSVCLFYSVNFLLGGGISALYYTLAGRTHTVMINGSANTLYADIPPGYFVLAASAVGLLCLFCGRIFAKKRASQPVQVEIWGSGCKVEFESLCDTGNLLCDPYNGKPVIVTGYMTVLPILPFDTKELFRTGDLTVLDQVDTKISHRVHVIPSRSVGGKGLMLVYTPDRVLVAGEEKDACIGILPTKENNDFGGYPAITPSLLC